MKDFLDFLVYSKAKNSINAFNGMLATIHIHSYTYKIYENIVLSIGWYLLI